MRWDVLLPLLVGERAGPGVASASAAHSAINWVAEHPAPPIIYFVSLYFASAASAWGLRRAVDKYRLDSAGTWYFRLFRSGSEWFYFFTGRDEFEQEDPHLVYVTTIVNLDIPYIYRGIFVRYFLKGNGELDRIILSGVARRKLSDDRRPGAHGDNPAFYEIEGDYFVLRYSEITTINIAYWGFAFEDMNVEEAEDDKMQGIV